MRREKTAQHRPHLQAFVRSAGCWISRPPSASPPLPYYIAGRPARDAIFNHHDRSGVHGRERCAVAHTEPNAVWLMPGTTPSMRAFSCATWAPQKIASWRGGTRSRLTSPFQHIASSNTPEPGSNRHQPPHHQQQQRPLMEQRPRRHREPPPLQTRPAHAPQWHNYTRRFNSAHTTCYTYNALLRAASVLLFLSATADKYLALLPTAGAPPINAPDILHGADTSSNLNLLAHRIFHLQ